MTGTLCGPRCARPFCSLWRPSYTVLVGQQGIYTSIATKMLNFRKVPVLHCLLLSAIDDGRMCAEN